MRATRTLTPEECDKAMGGIVYDRWSKVKRGKTKGMYDLSEVPQAYNNIDAVIEAENLHKSIEQPDVINNRQRARAMLQGVTCCEVSKRKEYEGLIVQHLAQEIA